MKQRVVFAALMSFVLAFFMTCWVTFINLGWSSQFFQLWGEAFVKAWPVAAVISFVLGPRVLRLTQWICSPRQAPAE